MSDPGWSSYGGQPPAPLVPLGYRIPVEHPAGTTVLVLGIVSLVVCPITGIFAITMGNRALREIDADPAAWSNRSMVSIGRVLGIVAVSVYGALAVAYGVFFAVVIGFFGYAGR